MLVSLLSVGWATSAAAQMVAGKYRPAAFSASFELPSGGSGSAVQLNAPLTDIISEIERQTGGAEMFFIRRDTQNRGMRVVNDLIDFGDGLIIAGDPIELTTADRGKVYLRVYNGDDGSLRFASGDDDSLLTPAYYDSSVSPGEFFLHTDTWLPLLTLNADALGYVVDCGSTLANPEFNHVCETTCTSRHEDFDPATRTCRECGDTEWFNVTTKSCESCPSDQVPASDHSTCMFCEGGKSPNTNRSECVCPSGMVSNSDGVCVDESVATTLACSGDKVPDSAGGQCVCPDGKMEDAGACVLTCTGDKTPNPAQTACECPEGMIERGGACESPFVPVVATVTVAGVPMTVTNTFATTITNTFEATITNTFATTVTAAASTVTMSFTATVQVRPPAMTLTATVRITNMATGEIQTVTVVGETKTVRITNTTGEIITVTSVGEATTVRVAEMSPASTVTVHNFVTTTVRVTNIVTGEVITVTVVGQPITVEVTNTTRELQTVTVIGQAATVRITHASGEIQTVTVFSQNVTVHVTNTVTGETSVVTVASRGVTLSGEPDVGVQSPSQSQGGSDGFLGFLGGMGAMAVAYWALNGTPEDLAFSPGYDYAFTNTGVVYDYSGRLDFRKENWHVWQSAGQGSDSAQTWRYAAGGGYHGDVWRLILSERITPETEDYDLSMSVKRESGVWTIAPTYYLHAKREYAQTTSVSHALQIQNVWRYHHWSVSSVAGWRDASDVGEHGHLRLYAVHEF